LKKKNDPGKNHQFVKQAIIDEYHEREEHSEDQCTKGKDESGDKSKTGFSETDREIKGTTLKKGEDPNLEIPSNGYVLIYRSGGWG